MTKISFGTDGWRDIIADNFTFDNVKKVTQAIMEYIKTTYPTDRPVIIGYDTRFLADDFAKVSAEVVASNGYNVLIPNKDMPTPVIAFAAKEFNSAGALMFTASHNPPKYCGIKYIPDYAGPATPEITDKIVQNLNNLSNDTISVKSKGKIENFDPKTPYINFIKTKLDLNKLANFNISICHDPLYATSRGYIEEVLKDISKCKVTTLHNHRDVLFGGSMPDPNEQILNEMKEFILKNKQDIGLANDGDADRCAAMDNEGTFYSPNMLIALLFRHLVKNKKFKGSVVRTIATTHLIDKLAKNYGIELVETPVGFKYVGAVMREREVIIGGEESGGISIYGHIPEKDGILANLLVVEMLAYEQKSLKEIWNTLIKEVGWNGKFKRIDLHLDMEVKNKIMDYCKNTNIDTIGNYKVLNKKCIDGVKFLLSNDTWILVRPSGTEPMIRVYLETPDSLEELESKVKNILLNI